MKPLSAVILAAGKLPPELMKVGNPTTNLRFLSRGILVQSAMTVTLVSTWQAWKLQQLRATSCGVVSIS